MSMYTFSARRARAFWSAERCFRIRPSPTWTRPGRPVFWPPVRTLYLDFETALYELGGRTPETTWREVGGEGHHGSCEPSPAHVSKSSPPSHSVGKEAGIDRKRVRNRLRTETQP